MSMKRQFKIVRYSIVLGVVLVALIFIIFNQSKLQETVETPPITTESATDIVAKYDIWEKNFSRNSGGYSNPWEQVTLTMTLKSPSGQTIAIGGFFYDTNIWKTRFSPNQTGNWKWFATISDGNASASSNGTLIVTTATRSGWVKKNPNNPFRWINDDGTPFYPYGLDGCVPEDINGNEEYGMGIDESYGTSPNPGHGGTPKTNATQFFSAFGGAGFTVFRFSGGDCIPVLWDSITINGNTYNVSKSKNADLILSLARQNGVRVHYTLFGNNRWAKFNRPPWPNPNAAELAATNRYVKYMSDRYGAYVDFWELANEEYATDNWINGVASYLKFIDPYKHPIAQWESVDDGMGAYSNLPITDFITPHHYQDLSDSSVDTYIVGRILTAKKSGKPVIFGEWGVNFGSPKWFPTSPRQFRTSIWINYFNEAGIIYWGSSGSKSGQNNYYIGFESQRYARIFRDYLIATDNPQMNTVHVTVSNNNIVRSYALTSPSKLGAYLFAYGNLGETTSGLTITVSPQSSGVATWTSPKTGIVLGSQNVNAGSQTLSVPNFIDDIALKII